MRSSRENIDWRNRIDKVRWAVGAMHSSGCGLFPKMTRYYGRLINYEQLEWLIEKISVEVKSKQEENESVSSPVRKV